MADEHGQGQKQEGTPQSADPAPRTHAPPDPGPDWGRISTFLYQRRVAGRLWAGLVTLSLLSGVAGFGLLKLLAFLTDAYLYEWMKSPGPWTALIVSTGLPVGLFVWFVRDRNKAMDQWHEQQRLEQNAADQKIAAGQLLHRTFEHAWVHFRYLQESITSGNAALQTAAIHQLRPFIMGESGGVIPKELLEPENHFISSAMAILRALLDDRSWLEKWKKEIEAQGDEAEAPSSPVLQAIESLLRAKGLPWKDFAGWNLSGLDLTRADWRGAKLFWANLRKAILPVANLQGADFHGAFLEGAFLRWSSLEGAVLQGAHLQGAILRQADLRQVDLWSADLQGADFTDAEIEEKWRDAIDWEKFELKGMPTFVKNEDDELPIKPDWLEEQEEADAAEAEEPTE